MSVSRSHRSSEGMHIRVFHEYKFILLFVLEYPLPPRTGENEKSRRSLFNSFDVARVQHPTFFVV
jgi:hypothetical protein